MKGKGGLAECQKCKSTNINVGDRDYIDHENMIQYVECLECRTIFRESWTALSWEEVL